MNRGFFLSLLPASLIVLGGVYGLSLLVSSPKRQGDERSREPELDATKKLALGLTRQSTRSSGRVEQRSTKSRRADVVYCLPYLRGNTFVVSQTTGETHFGTRRHAIDFQMPVGTPVHAAREGLVIQANQDFSEKGRTEEFKSQANAITVDHRDGTLAMYAHLQRHGSLVRVGQRVKRGQRIGFSGNTGFSTGPHLHFEVFELGERSEILSLPVLFRLPAGLATSVAAGQKYSAPEICD
jgi:murein DD-endopeptidase MepM/ murein hydrolase activator NlpD